MRLRQLLHRRQLAPDRPAFIHRDRTCADTEFLQMVTNAVYLFRSIGLERGDRLIIASAKSISVIAVIFACLEEGIVFVPIDYSSPKERIHYILGNSGAMAIFLDQVVMDRVGGATFTSVKDLTVIRDIPMEPIVHEISNAVSINAAPEGEDLAYLIYTSGSTGIPKGVAVQRAALASFLEAAAAKAGYSSDTRFLNFFPLHFDPVLMELLVPWVVGGTTVVFDRFVFIDSLIEVLQKHRITDFSCTPNIISMLVSRFSNYPRYSWDFLRSIWFGGESANASDLQKFHGISPHVKLLNGYGPTETVVACCVHELERGDYEKGVIPIGRPLPGVEFLLITTGEVIIGDGEGVGELYVGGAQLMKGYWGHFNDPSANKFVMLRDQIYYKTDDQVYQENGVYYFAGRSGNMIKMRGYRIYPQEVENTIRQIEMVGACYVFMDERGDYLVAAVEVDQPDIKFEAVLLEIKEFVSTRLPAYMIPGYYAIERKLPRLSNGKLDLNKIRGLVAH
ncbi:AMP-binding protein [Paenibacillus tianjinensis]|uniref:AMP-binding protein n=1 Tax=Paenibacillus tianjinensis TaxID=2810347 RepID=A0ABX7L8Q7_9BACL|nr:AMP-binding protein [Paenibacillus tianjinensis]QSF44392.1 AMP-binding protein [Paenibacillus tianjinensis]